jgi:uncharacterized protein YecT (DUF1311 family)/TPR repeat protein
MKPDDFQTLPPALRAQCVQSLRTPLPAEANAAPVTPSRTNAMNLYYGLYDQPRDYVAARRTAWGERAAGSTGGPLILAMVYANGLGAPRDPPLAMRMACEAAVSSATSSPTISAQDLEQFSLVLQSRAQSPPQYDICDPATETPSAASNLCPFLETERIQQQWSDRMKNLGAGWTPEQKQRLDALRHASESYLSTISFDWGAHRTDQAVLKKLEDTQLQQIGEMEAGQLPATTKMHAAEADAQLNAVYRNLMDQLRAPSQPLDGTHSIFFERDEETEWIAFRDAWIGLMAARYPKLDADKWRAQLTIERMQALRKLAASLPPVDPKAKAWLSICAQYRGTPLPQDMRAAQPSSAQLCSSARSYYGLGVPVNYAEARRCAILERPYGTFVGSGDTALNELDIGGAATLTMIYADGKGVARNKALAMRFACEAIDGQTIGAPEDPSPYDPAAEAEADRATMLKLLHDVAATGAKESGPSAADLDICNYMGDPDRAQTRCEYINKVRVDLQRKADIDAFAAKFNPDQKAAFAKLVSAFETYLEAHDGQESNVEPHLRNSGGWVGDTPQWEEDFIATMHRFESGDLPSHTAAQYVEADRNLNAEYQEMLKVDPSADPNLGDYPPSPEGLRDTQDIWLKYRDAWVAFGRLRYPQVSEVSWLTWITTQRFEQLKGVR